MVVVDKILVEGRWKPNNHFKRQNPRPKLPASFQPSDGFFSASAKNVNNHQQSLLWLEGKTMVFAYLVRYPISDQFCQENSGSVSTVQEISGPLIHKTHTLGSLFLWVYLTIYDNIMKHHGTSIF